jgi:hypothetical protein
MQSRIRRVFDTLLDSHTEAAIQQHNLSNYLKKWRSNRIFRKDMMHFAP